MNSRRHNLLLIDDDPVHAEALKAALTTSDDELSEFKWARSLAGGMEGFNPEGVWAIFLNLRLPDGQGVDAFDRLRLLAVATPIVVLGGRDDEDICKEAMLHGADDFLLEGHVDDYSFARALRNITEREVATRELFVEKERAQVTLNSIGDAVLSTDMSGNVTYLNAVAEAMTGWSCKEAVGRALTDVFQITDAATREPSPNPMESAVRQNKAVALTANCLLIRRDGHECAIEDLAAPIHDRDGQVTGAVIVFHDVSTARALAGELSHLAQHDPLTDLPNRLLLNDRLTQSILLARRNQKQVAVLFVDLDGFKHINDSLGHAVGDKLLQSVATRLSGCVRHSDTVSRQGGDEFVILLSEVGHAKDPAISAAKIIAEVGRAHSIHENRLHVTASIGISTYPEGGEDAETLIKNADAAMYHAKGEGQGNYRFFQKEMNRQAVERQSIEGQLREALERNEMVLYYQPKINLIAGVVTSAEALLRWRHPERGILLPEHFLGIAEDTGLILAIGRWVVREACRQTRAWLDGGLTAVPVAVNISSPEFRSEHFVEDVRAALENACVDPRYLELELTETVLMRHVESTVGVLERFRVLGVRLTVDDFGTGFSSLSYLTRFPIDAVKLDQSFVRNVIANKNDALVVSTVVSMCKSLKHRVIAEGVETAKQSEFLQGAGCDEAQGFYFSRPLDPWAFAKLLLTDLVLPAKTDPYKEGHEAAAATSY